MGAVGCVEGVLRRSFGRLGSLVGRRPWAFLVLPVLATLGSGAGLVGWREETRVWWVYSPRDARSHAEHAVFRDFFDEGQAVKTGISFAFWATDGGDVLRPEHLSEVVSVLDFVERNLTVWVADEEGGGAGREWAFADFCGRHCNDTEIVDVFHRIRRRPDLRNSPNYKITWPIMEFFHNSFYVGDVFLGVETDSAGTLEAAKVVKVTYFVAMEGDFERRRFDAWDIALMRFATSYKSERLRLSSLSDGVVSHEVRRNGTYIAPYIGVSLASIFVFVFLSSLHKNAVKSKPWEALGAVLCPGMAIVTTFGLLLGPGGYDFVALYSVVPFLVLAIGVDDAFILLHAWHKSADEGPGGGTCGEAGGTAGTVGRRMGEALGDAAPSITMTTLTNVASFLVGATSLTPGIHGFCLFTATGIAIGFLYQVTFFAAVMALGGAREAAGRNAYLICVTTGHRRVEPLEAKGRKAPLRALPSSASHRFAETFLYRVCARYSRVITLRGVKALVGVGLVGYWALSVFGFSRMKVVMSPSKTVLRDSPLNAFMEHVDSHAWETGNYASFFFAQPPDFRKPDELRQFLRLVSRLETLPHSMGPNSTNLWLRKYLDDLQLLAANPFEEFYHHLPKWLADRPQFDVTVKWRDAAELSTLQPLQVFFFTTGFRDTVSWAKREVAMVDFREVVDAYPEFGGVYYQLNSFYLDQQRSIRGVTIMTVSIALAVMCLICLVFIPNLTSVLAATAAMLSINLGVFGFLELWSIDLDPISMITILMSIGFSVDFTCHMSYHYHRSLVEAPVERLTDALVSIGWPMVQAGVSTLVGISVLVVPDSYMSEVFIKTCFLVISLGLVHGLLILPVVLTSLPSSLPSWVPCCRAEPPDPLQDLDSCASTTPQWASVSSDAGSSGAGRGGEEGCWPQRRRELCCAGASRSSSVQSIRSPATSSTEGRSPPSQLRQALRRKMSLPAASASPDLKPPLKPALSDAVVMLAYNKAAL